MAAACTLTGNCHSVVQGSALAKLLKSGFVFSALTGVSRLLGLVRDIVIATLLGVSPGTDVFFVALSLSQMLRGMALEGPVLQTVVSTFSRRMVEMGVAAVRVLAARLGAFVLLMSSALIVFCFIFPESVVLLVGSGFLIDPSRGELARAWLPVALAYALPILLVGVLVAIQNSADLFASTATTPIIFNLCIIGALLLAADDFNNGARYPLVVLAIPVAGAIQYGFHCWRSVHHGLYRRVDFSLDDVQLRRLLILLVPALYTMALTQASTVSNNIIGSFLPVGSLSWINYANRVAILPVGVLGIALVTVLVPTLSRVYADASDVRDAERDKKFGTLLGASAELLLLLGLPSAVGLYVLAEAISFSLFQYGALGADDALRISWALAVLAFNVPASMLASLFVAAFFTRHLPAVPLRVSLILLPLGLAVKIACVVIFGIFDLAYVGLATGVSIAAWINVALLWRGLSQHGIQLLPKVTRYAGIVRTLIALCAMALIVDAAAELDWYRSTWSVRAINLAFACLSGVCSYVLCLWLLGGRIPRVLMRQA